MTAQFGAEGSHRTPEASDPESAESGLSCPDISLRNEAWQEGKKQCWLGPPWLGAGAFSPVDSWGWEPTQHRLIYTLILSLLSPSSIPISEAPAPGEFESVRAVPLPRAWVGVGQGGGSPVKSWPETEECSVRQGLTSSKQHPHFPGALWPE